MNSEKMGVRFDLVRPFGHKGIRSVRKTVSFLAGQWGFTRPACDNIALALSEAINNAMEHGSGKGDRVKITCTIGDPVGIRLTVEDFGGDETNGENSKNESSLKEAIKDSGVMPDTDSERGRGVFLIHSLMDEVRMERKKGGGVLIIMTMRGP